MPTEQRGRVEAWESSWGPRRLNNRNGALLLPLAILVDRHYEVATMGERPTTRTGKTEPMSHGITGAGETLTASAVITQAEVQYLEAVEEFYSVQSEQEGHDEHSGDVGEPVIGIVLGDGSVRIPDADDLCERHLAHHCYETFDFLMSDRIHGRYFRERRARHRQHLADLQRRRRCDRVEAARRNRILACRDPRQAPRAPRARHRAARVARQQAGESPPGPPGAPPRSGCALADRGTP